MNETTFLRAQNLVPSGMKVSIEYPNLTLTTLSECPAGTGVRAPRAPAVHNGSSVTLRRCIEGAATVRLLARSDGHELDRVTIGPTPTNSLSSVSGLSSVNYEERRTDAVTQYTGSDPDPGDTVTLSLGGTDANDFGIDADGNLTFSVPPDYENPQDTGSNNVYNVTVSSSDGKDSQGNPNNNAIDHSISVTVTVLDVPPPGKPGAPSVSGDGATRLSVNWSAPSDNGAAITDYDVQYREGTTGSFSDTSHSGIATMTTISSNLEPDTCYQVQVLAKSDEGPSPWSDSGNGCTDERSGDLVANPTDIAVGQPTVVRAQNLDPSDMDVTITFPVGILTKESQCSITQSRAPRAPGVHEGKSVTLLRCFEGAAIVRLLGDGHELDRVTIGPTPTNSLSSVSGLSSVNYEERRTDAVTQYTGSDPDPGDTVTLSLGGTDANDFGIDADGNLTFSVPPDYENPQDTGSNNVYNVTVSSSDGKDSQGNPNNNAIDHSISVTVTVTDVNEAPEAASQFGDQNLALGGAAVVIDLSDKFTDPDGDTLTYGTSLSATGVVTAGVDSGDLTITPAGVGSATVTVTAYDRPMGDPERMSGSQSFDVTVGTDLTVSFENSEYEVLEGEMLRITVNLSAAAPTGGLDIPIVMSPSPAPAPMGEYSVSGLMSGALKIPAGQTSTSFTIAATQDTVPEGDEKINLSFNDQPADGVVAGMHSSATVTIPYNDLTVSFGSSDYTVVEGDSVEVEVTLNAAPGSDLEIPIQVTRVSAEATDYTVGASVTFAGTSDSATLTVGATDEPSVEGDETIRLGFGDMPSGGVTAGTPNTTTVTIKDKLPQLAKPTGPGLNAGIDVVPVAARDKERPRSIELIWYPAEGVTDATTYEVVIQALGGEWTSPRTETTHLTSIYIDLDEILEGKGLADHPYAYEIQVRAIDDRRHSDYSDSVIVIDTPITEASGDAEGNVSVDWTDSTIQGLLLGGSEHLRYRKLGGDYAGDARWNAVEFETAEVEFPLEADTIYAIQFRYETDNSVIYAARDAYAWTTDYEGIAKELAGFELRRTLRLSGGMYKYRICEETFGPNEKRVGAWRDLIQHALNQWQLATNVTMFFDEDFEGKSKPCDDLSGAQEQVTETMESQGLGDAKDLESHVDGLMTNLRNTNLVDNYFQRQDEIAEQLGSTRVEKLNEIIMLPHIDFPEIGFQAGVEPCSRDADGCVDTVAFRDKDYFFDDYPYTVDIYIRRKSFEENSGVMDTIHWNPIDPLQIPGEVRFNTCGFEDDETYSGADIPAYQVMVHEAGHALGLYDHTGVVDSVMYRGLRNKINPRCSPHPFDIMTINTMYGGDSS